MEPTKKCVTCHEVKLVTDFNRRRAAPDGLQARCRSCARSWYERNKASHVANVRVNSVAREAEYSSRIGDYLLEHPCVDCGEADVRVLDFDHLDAADKYKEISRLRDTSSWSRIVAEIGKCDVVCANCHRKRTAARGGHWREHYEAAAAERRVAAANARLQRLFSGP